MCFMVVTILFAMLAKDTTDYLEYKLLHIEQKNYTVDICLNLSEQQVFELKFVLMHMKR